jgi:hypothetical protein
MLVQLDCFAAFADFHFLQEVIQNMSNKFEGVKKDVHIGRDRILREATSNLHEMRSKW